MENDNLCCKDLGMEMLCSVFQTRLKKVSMETLKKFR